VVDDLQLVVVALPGMGIGTEGELPSLPGGRLGVDDIVRSWRYTEFVVSEKLHQLNCEMMRPAQGCST